MKKKLISFGIAAIVGLGVVFATYPNAQDVVEIPADLRPEYDTAISKINELKKQAEPYQVTVSQVCTATLARAKVKPSEYELYELDEKNLVLRRKAKQP